MCVYLFRSVCVCVKKKKSLHVRFAIENKSANMCEDMNVYIHLHVKCDKNVIYKLYVHQQIHRSSEICFHRQI